ncbi:hypothetical protein CVT26_007218, partial [Gymnopilus dilepis]
MYKEAPEDPEDDDDDYDPDDDLPLMARRTAPPLEDDDDVVAAPLTRLRRKKDDALAGEEKAAGGEGDAPETSSKANAQCTPGPSSASAPHNAVAGPSRRKSKTKKSPALVDDEGTVAADGSLYPACGRCIRLQRPCVWKQDVIHHRLLRIYFKTTSCIPCVSSAKGCKFVWESDDGLKRKADAADGKEGRDVRPRIYVGEELSDVLGRISAALDVIAKAMAQRAHEDKSAIKELIECQCM